MKRALLAALLLAAPAAAQTLDMTQGGPIEITSLDGIEWRQQEQVVIARGNARAVRDGVTVDADRLIARYRPRAGNAPAAPPAGHEACGRATTEHHAQNVRAQQQLQLQRLRVRDALRLGGDARAIHDRRRRSQRRVADV